MSLNPGDNEKKITEVADMLKSATSRQEGRAILLSQRFNVEQLKILARFSNVQINTAKKADLIDRIIEGTIGYRIDSKIIQNHKWQK